MCLGNGQVNCRDDEAEHVENSAVENFGKGQGAGKRKVVVASRGRRKVTSRGRSKVLVASRGRRKVAVTVGSSSGTAGELLGRVVAAGIGEGLRRQECTG